MRLATRRPRKRQGRSDQAFTFLIAVTVTISTDITEVMLKVEGLVIWVVLRVEMAWNQPRYVQTAIARNWLFFFGS